MISSVFRQSLVLVRREASLVSRTLSPSAQSPEQGHCREGGGLAGGWLIEVSAAGLRGVCLSTK